MKCEDIESKIALYASGDLDRGGSAAISSHISRCPVCASRLRHFQADLHALRSLKKDTVEQSDLDAVRRRVMAAVGVQKTKAWQLHRLLRPAYVAAAAVPIALLVWWLSTPWTTHAPDAPVPVASESGKPADPTVTASHAAVPATISAGAPSRKPLREESRPAHMRPITEVASDSTAAKPYLFTPGKLPQDDIAIKLETADPNVVIIWLASSKGGEQR